jgi:hypothetical protein
MGNHEANCNMVKLIVYNNLPMGGSGEQRDNLAQLVGSMPLLKP